MTAQGLRDSALSHVVGFIESAIWGELPVDVQAKARLCLVDDLAALLAGLAAPVSGVAADFAASHCAEGSATVIASAATASSSGAAFANACAANAVDIDDCGIYTWGHPGAQIFPAALAVAESEGCTGAEMLTALVVGYEVAFRVARCFHDYHETYRACGSWGAVACAAAAASLMRLSEAQIVSALGIAEYFSPYAPMLNATKAPTMMKHATGWGAMTGVAAADLARRGFTASPAVIARDVYLPWLSDLGAVFLLPRGITWKEFSCCAWAHPALLAVRRLRAAHEFEPQDVAHVTVETFSEAAGLGGGGLPATTEEAQFSVAWPLAALLVDGCVDPEQVTSRLDDPLIRALSARVDVVASEELTHLYHLAEADDPDGETAAVVTIELNDGRRLQSERTNHVLYPEPAWSSEQVECKFRRLVAPILGAGAEEVLGVATAVDELASASSLTAAIVSGLGAVK